MLDAVSDSVFVTDQAGIVLFVNRSGLELLGLHPEEVVGRHVREFHPGEIGRRYAFCGVPFKFTNRTGREIEVIGTHGEVSTQGGLRYFFIAKEATEVRRSEELRQEFMRMVGHELRNPVQVTKSISQVMRLRLNSNQTEDASKLLDLLDFQLNRIAKLLEDILLAYRTGSGRLTLQLAPVDLGEVVRDSVAPYVLAETHDIEVEEGEGRGLAVLCDRERLVQILANLLDNAVKYTPRGKKIRVRVGLAAPSQAVVTVEDEGIGIPQDELEKVFSGFYRARNVRGYASGLGLGLYISRELARCQGGDVWAENAPAGGTRMYLRLPLYKKDAHEAAQEGAQEGA